MSMRNNLEKWCEFVNLFEYLLHLDQGCCGPGNITFPLCNITLRWKTKMWYLFHSYDCIMLYHYIDDLMEFSLIFRLLLMLYVGDIFHAAPNIDHSQDFVRKDIKGWLNWLRNDIGFDGWRLDFVR